MTPSAGSQVRRALPHTDHPIWRPLRPEWRAVARVQNGGYA